MQDSKLTHAFCTLWMSSDKETKMESIKKKKNTIKKKLVFIILGITFAVLMITNIAQSITSYYTMRTETTKHIELTASITGKNLASSLDFMDRKAAQQTVKSLAFEDSIYRACVYDAYGTLFTDYQRKDVEKFFGLTDADTSCPYSYSNVKEGQSLNDIHIAHPITINNKRLGWLLLDYNLTESHINFVRQEIYAIFIIIFAMVLAYIFTVRLQKVITGPILELAGVAEKLSKDQDFSVRVKNESNDELGTLIDAFNSMLERIERRDSELLKAREEADNANAMKGQFLATMSHEIRTPMTGIIGMAELLLGSTLDRRQEGHVRTIIGSGESLLNIINDILDFSKIEAGKLEFDPMPVDLLELIDDIGLLYSVKAREKAIELVIHYRPGTEQFIFIDPVRIRQIISNLINNAIKFTDRGHIALSVEHDENIRAPEGYVQLLFSVRDTGIGISKEYQKKIFEKFSQADASTTRQFGGTGLGLAICKNLVEMMGGTIWVESEERNGSVFYCSIPCLRNTTETAKFPEIKSLQNTKVMVVDDLHINLQIISEQLEDYGARCDVAANGEQALKKMKNAATENDPFRLAIIDYLMPEMNGEMLACAIKDDPELADCCLIMLTAAGNISVSDAYIEKGFSAHISKPVCKYVFLEALDYIWSKYQAGTRDKLIRVDMHNLGRDTTETIPILKDLKVLMAEDNLVNQVFIQEIIEEMQCDLTITQNGQEALSAVQTRKFDLVLMDCLMPVMDGFEATRTMCKLKEQGKLDPNLPIIALTANAMKGDREKCLKAGMNDYLAKPIRKKELQDTIIKWVIKKDQETKGEETMEDNANTAVILDEEAVNSAREILKGKYDSMVTVYIENSREYINEMTKALQANDVEAIIRPAHTLKSTSKQMGAMKLSEIAKNIEYMAKALAQGETESRQQNIDTISQSLANLNQTLNETKDAFGS